MSELLRNNTARNLVAASLAAFALVISGCGEAQTSNTAPQPDKSKTWEFGVVCPEQYEAVIVSSEMGDYFNRDEGMVDISCVNGLAVATPRAIFDRNIVDQDKDSNRSSVDIKTSYQAHEVPVVEIDDTSYKSGKHSGTKIKRLYFDNIRKILNVNVSPSEE